jgi:hypothetical protein
MTRYTIRYQNEPFDVKSDSELVSVMRENLAFVPAASDAEFMEELAKQIKMESGEEIRTKSATKFVVDLLRIEFIKIDMTEGNEDEDGEEEKI